MHDGWLIMAVSSDERRLLVGVADNSLLMKRQEREREATSNNNRHGRVVDQ